MTTNAKHTPGPWVWMDEKYDKRDGYGPVSDFEVSNLRGETHNGRLFPHHLQAGDDWILRGVWQTNDDATLTVSPADALLIAAAPDLLAACEAVLHEEDEAARGNRGLSVVCDEEILRHLSETVWPMLRAAIAKAKGESD